jgi:transcriptional regulator with XRE-family HTH domain
LDARAEIGRRIARQRRRRGLSQTVLAGLVGRSESWLSQVERGLRSIDSHSVLVRLADVLGVEISQLIPSETDTEIVKYEPAAGIREAMARYGALPGIIKTKRTDVGRRPRLRWLRHEMHRANRLYQATRYDEAGRLLPGLIDAAEESWLSCSPTDRRAADTLRALIYHSATMTLSRVGEAELAWMAADRSIAAAETAERPLLGAVSAYRLGYVLIRLNRAGQAEDLAMRAADALSSMRRPTAPTLSLRGALHLAAASAAAARFDRASTDRHLAVARVLAGKAGKDRNDFWSAFGPTNVAIHEVSTAVTFGDAKLALRHGETLDVEHLGPELRGRRTQILLDLARAYGQTRKDAAAVNTLLKAEQTSPELVRYDQRTNELLSELVRREHRVSTPELRGLAHRAGVI